MRGKGQTAVSTDEVTVINQCHVLPQFAQPSVVRQVVAGVAACMRSCLSPLRQGFRLLMIEHYESCHALLKPPPRGF